MISPTVHDPYRSSAEEANSSPAFRRDINALRALAVIAVTLYHFNIPGFSGGFIGVDVFFVISGYLMTGIILAGLGEGKFSLLNFYLARVKRIVPALVALCAILLVVCCFLPLTGFEYKTLAKHVGDSLLFTSNLTYSREAGYFDGAAHEKWLLHTWSLSLEWQFYLSIPLILLATRRWLRQPNRVSWVLAGLLACSLGLCVYKTPLNPVSAFFGLKYRAWELLSGGLVYVFSSRCSLLRRNGTLVSFAGFLALFCCIGFFGAGDVWPGWRATVPVFSTVLILFARREEAWLIRNPISQYLGTRSYSIYLWHWPFVVALGLYEWRMHWPAVASAFLLSIVLGALSYRWVETPTRQWQTRFSRKQLWFAAIIGTLAVWGPATWIKQQEILPFRSMPENVTIAEKEVGNVAYGPLECWNGRNPAGCIYGKAPVGALMIGDSHSGSLLSAVADTLNQAGKGLRFWGKEACMTVFDIKIKNAAGDDACSKFNASVREEIAKADRNLPLIIANRSSLYPLGLLQGEAIKWGKPLAIIPGSEYSDQAKFFAEYRRRLISTACHYAQSRPVYYVKPIPEFPASVPNTMARRLMRDGERAVEVSLPLAEYHKRHAFILDALNEAQRRCGIHLLDPVPYLCANGECLGSFKGRPLYSDNNHLSAYGNRFLAPMFREVAARGQ